MTGQGSGRGSSDCSCCAGGGGIGHVASGPVLLNIAEPCYTRDLQRLFASCRAEWI